MSEPPKDLPDDEPRTFEELLADPWELFDPDSEILSTLMDWSSGPPPPSVLPVAPTPGSNILDQMQEYARRLLQRPVASRLEVGPVADVLLRAAIPRAEPAPWGVSPVAALTGLPIVVNDELGPAGWQLLDADGEVLKSGTMWHHSEEERSGE